MIEEYNVPASVRTVHVLASGELIYSREEYEKVKDRFTWVDQQFILSEILRLRRLTDNGKQTLIAVYEEGRLVKSFMNLGFDFHPTDVLSR